MSRVGLVALVGAGPGDPGLITVKAMEYIKRADVIVYDRLVNPLLLDHASETCELVYVGKTPKHHTKTQDEINDILVAQARDWASSSSGSKAVTPSYSAGAGRRPRSSPPKACLLRSSPASPPQSLLPLTPASRSPTETSPPP